MKETRSRLPKTRLENSLLKYTPKLFEMIEWLTLLSVIRFVVVKTESTVMLIFYGIAFIVFVLYYNVYISYEIDTNSSKTFRIFAHIIAAFFGVSLAFIIEHIIELLSQTA